MVRKIVSPIIVAVLLMGTLLGWAQARRYEFGPVVSQGVDPDTVTLGTDTTGDYVESITNGTGITGGDGGSEGAALTIVATLGTAITTGEITDGEILYGDLDADVVPEDGDFLQADSTGTNFTWRSPSETLSDIMTAQPATLEHRWTFTLADPTALLALDAEWVFDPCTAGAITIESFYCSLDADPTAELDADLYYADAGVGYTSETLINTCNTTAGVVALTSFSGDATIAEGKKVYFKITSVDAATTQINCKGTWTYD